MPCRYFYTLVIEGENCTSEGTDFPECFNDLRDRVLDPRIMIITSVRIFHPPDRQTRHHDALTSLGYAGLAHDLGAFTILILRYGGRHLRKNGVIGVFGIDHAPVHDKKNPVERG